MKAIKIKTIDVTALEWFDKINGNSYFAGTVVINYGMKTERKFIMPFQYGYGDQYKYEAFSTLQKAGLIPEVTGQYWKYCQDNKIIVRYTKHENCKQRELKNIS